MDKDQSKIIVNITGDFCYSDILVGSGLQKEVLDDNLKDIFSLGDVNITNLECPITNQESKKRKSGPHLKTSPDTAKLIKSLNLHVVTIANNHILDYRTAGLKDTIQHLTENGIKFVGAGDNIQAAEKTLYLEIKGKVVAVHNFTAHEFTLAQETRPGANPVDIIENYRQITEAKIKADYQIVVVHMGIEHYEYPTPGMMKLFRFYASLGVSAVVGHHSHCINGYEIYKDVPIFYGLGNFIFAEEGSPPTWHEGLMLQLSFGKTGNPEYRTYRFKQQSEGYLPKLSLINEDLPEKLSSEVVDQRWKEHLQDNFKRRNILNHLQRKSFLSRGINKLFPSLTEKGIDYSYLNLLRNECNHEYLLGILEEIIGEDN